MNNTNLSRQRVGQVRRITEHFILLHLIVIFYVATFQYNYIHSFSKDLLDPFLLAAAQKRETWSDKEITTIKCRNTVFYFSTVQL